eukprot:m.45159 g.45159  ORF g.45159 m.45159 type:complete len:2887 (+) comp10869_c2_seq2:165-8825(+)
MIVSRTVLRAVLGLVLVVHASASKYPLSDVLDVMELGSSTATASETCPTSSTFRYWSSNSQGAEFRAPDVNCPGTTLQAAVSFDAAQQRDYEDYWWSSPTNGNVSLTFDLDAAAEGVSWIVGRVSIDFASRLPDNAIMERKVNGNWMPWRYFSRDCVNDFPQLPVLTLTNEADTFVVGCSPISSYSAPISFDTVFLFYESTGVSSQSRLDFSRSSGFRIRLLDFALLPTDTAPFASGNTPADYVNFGVESVTVEAICDCYGHASSCDTGVSPPVCTCSDSTDGNQCDRCEQGFQGQAWQRSTPSSSFTCAACPCNPGSTVPVTAAQLLDPTFACVDASGQCTCISDTIGGYNCQAPAENHFARFFDYFSFEVETAWLSIAARVGEIVDNSRFSGYGAALLQQSSPSITVNFVPTGAVGSFRLVLEFYLTDVAASQSLEAVVTVTTTAGVGSPSTIIQTLGSTSNPYTTLVDTLTLDSTVTNIEVVLTVSGAFPPNVLADRLILIPDTFLDAEGALDAANWPDFVLRASQLASKAGNTCSLYGTSTGSDNCDDVQTALSFLEFGEAFACDCDEVGTLAGTTCNPNGGQCACAPNAFGLRCDMCEAGYYPSPQVGGGCIPCECASYGVVQQVCDATGACLCKDNFVNDDCSECRTDTVYDSSIQECEVCSACVLGLEDKLTCLATEASAYDDEVAWHSNVVDEIVATTAFSDALASRLATRYNFYSGASSDIQLVQQALSSIVSNFPTAAVANTLDHANSTYTRAVALEITLEKVDQLIQDYRDALNVYVTAWFTAFRAALQFYDPSLVATANALADPILNDGLDTQELLVFITDACTNATTTLSALQAANTDNQDLSAAIDDLINNLNSFSESATTIQEDVQELVLRINALQSLVVAHFAEYDTLSSLADRTQRTFDLIGSTLSRAIDLQLDDFLADYEDRVASLNAKIAAWSSPSGLFTQLTQTANGVFALLQSSQDDLETVQTHVAALSAVRDAVNATYNALFDTQTDDEITNAKNAFLAAIARVSSISNTNPSLAAQAADLQAALVQVSSTTLNTQAVLGALLSATLPGLNTNYNAFFSTATDLDELLQELLLQLSNSNFDILNLPPFNPAFDTALTNAGAGIQMYTVALNNIDTASLAQTRINLEGQVSTLVANVAAAVAAANAQAVEANAMLEHAQEFNLAVQTITDDVTAIEDQLVAVQATVVAVSQTMDYVESRLARLKAPSFYEFVAPMSPVLTNGFVQGPGTFQSSAGVETIEFSVGTFGNAALGSEESVSLKFGGNQIPLTYSLPFASAAVETTQASFTLGREGKRGTVLLHNPSRLSSPVDAADSIRFTIAGANGTFARFSEVTTATLARVSDGVSLPPFECAEYPCDVVLDNLWKLPADYQVTVTIQTGSVIDRLTFTVAGQPDVVDTNVITVVVPSIPLSVGDRITFAVYAGTITSLTASFSCQSVDFETVTTDSERFDVATQVSDTGAAVMTATISNNAAASPTPEPVFYVTGVVTSEILSTRLEGQLFGITFADGRKLTTASPVYYNGRRNFRIVDTRLVSFIPHVVGSSVVNMAPITNTSFTTSVEFVAYDFLGSRLAVDVAGMACQTSAPFVFGNGATAATGAACATMTTTTSLAFGQRSVSFTYDGVTSTSHVEVIAPTRVWANLDDPCLSLIDATCLGGNLYQSTTFALYAAMSDGSVVDITELAKDQILVDTGILLVQNNILSVINTVLANPIETFLGIATANPALPSTPDHLAIKLDTVSITGLRVETVNPEDVCVSMPEQVFFDDDEVLLSVSKPATTTIRVGSATPALTAVYAIYSDGTVGLVPYERGLRIIAQSSATASRFGSSYQLLAGSTTGQQTFTAEWNPPMCLSTVASTQFSINAVALSGSLDVNMQLDELNRLAAQGSPVNSIGIPTVSRPLAFVTYSSRTELSSVGCPAIDTTLDVTLSASLQQTPSRTNAVIQFQTQPMLLFGSAPGAVDLEFVYGGVTQTVAITIVQQNSFSASLAPFPVAGDALEQPAQLCLIPAATLAYPQYEIQAVVVLTGGSTVVLAPGTYASELSIEAFLPGSVQQSASAVVDIELYEEEQYQVLTPTAPSVVYFNVKHQTRESQRFEYEATTTASTPTALNCWLVGSDTATVSNLNQALACDIELACYNNTRRISYDSLFQVGFDQGGVSFPSFTGVRYPGLISFFSDSPHVSVSSQTGVATALSNSAELVNIYASSHGAESNMVSVAANLDPLEGDFDLGAESGVAVPAVNVGDEFTVPVRVNVGSNTLGSFDYTITWDPATLRFVSAGSFGDAALLAIDEQGVFEGKLRFVGVASLVEGGAFTGIITLPWVRFEAIAGGSAVLSGWTDALLTPGLNSTQIGAMGTFVAGEVPLAIMGARRRSVDAAPLSARSTHSLARRETAGCTFFAAIVRQSCADPQPCPSVLSGDLNGDCVVDVQDLLFELLYVLESNIGFSTPQGALVLTIANAVDSRVDVNGDGVLSSLDVSAFSKDVLFEPAVIIPANYKISFQGDVNGNDNPLRFPAAFQTAFELSVLDDVTTNDCGAACDADLDCLGFLYDTFRLQCRLLSDLGDPAGLVTQTESYSFARKTAPEFDGFSLQFEGLTPTYRVAPFRFPTGFDSAATIAKLVGGTLSDCIASCDAEPECVGVFYYINERNNCQMLNSLGPNRGVETSSVSYSYAKIVPLVAPSGYSVAFEGNVLTNEGEPLRFSTAFDARFILNELSDVNVTACANACDATESCVGFLMVEFASGVRCQLLSSTGSRSGVPTSTTSVSYARDIALAEVEGYTNLGQTPPANLRFGNAFDPTSILSKHAVPTPVLDSVDVCATLCSAVTECQAFFVYTLDGNASARCHLLNNVGSLVTTSLESVSFARNP